MSIPRLIPALIILLLLASPLKSLSSNQVVISGTGYAAPLGTHPITTVKIYDKPSMTLLGTTTTDVNGNYSYGIYPVGIDNHKQTGLSGVILKNPYQDKLEIAISAQVMGTYILQISDMTGITLLSKSVLLQSGYNTLTIAGLGVAGMKTIQLSGYGQKVTLKAIQSASSASSPTVKVTHSDVQLLKSEPLSDSLLVSFVPPTGYTGIDTTVDFRSQPVNYVVQQIPTYAINTTFKTYDVNGDTANITITATGLTAQPIIIQPPTGRFRFKRTFIIPTL